MIQQEEVHTAYPNSSEQTEGDCDVSRSLLHIALVTSSLNDNSLNFLSVFARCVQHRLALMAAWLV